MQAVGGWGRQQGAGPPGYKHQGSKEWLLGHLLQWATALHSWCGTIRPLAHIAMLEPGIGEQRLGGACTHVFTSRRSSLRLWPCLMEFSVPLDLAGQPGCIADAGILGHLPLTTRSVVYRDVPLRDHPSRHLEAKRGVEALKLSPCHVRHCVTEAKLWSGYSCPPPNSSLQFG